MRLQIFGQLEFEKIMPFLIGTIFLVAVMIVLNKTIKNIFFQSAYMEVLRDFAGMHGYKKPISKWLFILIEIAGLFLAMFFIASFFKNAFLTTGVLTVLMLLSAFVAIKYYTPPFKAFARAESLIYTGDTVYGNYRGRNIVLKMEKETIEFHIEPIEDRHKKIDFVKRNISVSLSLDDESIESVTYENGKIEVTPDTLKADFALSDKMLSKIPPSDHARMSISTINGEKYLTLEKTYSSFLFTAELYYLCEAAGQALDAINDSVSYVTKAENT